jgi:hypothetical protein
LPVWPGNSGLLQVSLGLASCLVIYAGVVAAAWSIEALRRAYGQSLPSGQQDPGLPPLVGSLWAYLCGLLVPLCLPLLFVVGWLVVLLKFA